MLYLRIRSNYIVPISHSIFAYYIKQVKDHVEDNDGAHTSEGRAAHIHEK